MRGELAQRWSRCRFFDLRYDTARNSSDSVEDGRVSTEVQVKAVCKAVGQG